MNDSERNPTHRPDLAGEGVDPSAAESSRREVPLKLADDTSDGSTLAVPTASSAESKGASASMSSSAVHSESSTGGFETLLGKLVVRSGFVTREELDHCNEQLSNMSSSDPPQMLADVLIASEFMTKHQLNRLRQEFEAQKSTQHIPGYKIIKRLGSGAMATVFLAKQLSLDRPVAIKILPRKFSDNPKFIERFLKEGRSAAKLNHPNIVGAYDVGRAGEHHFFVMEYVDGRTVHDRIQKQKRVKEREALEIVKQVARALEHAHSRGFVHRDIKPKNIMITKNGVVKLADLGLARAMSDEEAAKAEAGRAYGTPYYISPEQIRGEVTIGPAADIYGLGATLYHMVTGRVPFEGKNPSSVMHKHLKEPLEPPDHVNPEVSAGCAQVIEMMMAKRVKDRYHDVRDLIQDIDLVIKGQPPHFAHQTLDPATVSQTLTSVVETAPVVQSPKSKNAPSLMQHPVFLIILVFMLFSMLANVILVSVVLSGK